MTNVYLKTAFDHIRRAPYQALAAFFVLTVTFFVITLMATSLFTSEKLLKHFETRPQIIAFLKDNISDEQARTLEDKLKNDDRISQLKYVSKEEALELYKNATRDNPLLTELISPSTFPASIEVSTKDLSHAEAIISYLKNEEIIDQVGFTATLGGEDSLNSVVQKLRDISWYVRLVGGIFTLILTGTSFLVLIVIIGMRMTTRRGEMEILDLIGATPAFIRSPIIVEALTYAISGVLMGWLLGFLLVLYLTPSLINYFGQIQVFPRDPVNLLGLFGILLGAELIVGLFLALTGSILAVSRVRRK